MEDSWYIIHERKEGLNDNAIETLTLKLTTYTLVGLEIIINMS